MRRAAGSRLSLDPGPVISACITALDYVWRCCCSAFRMPCSPAALIFRAELYSDVGLASFAALGGRPSLPVQPDCRPWDSWASGARQESISMRPFVFGYVSFWQFLDREFHPAAE